MAIVSDELGRCQCKLVLKVILGFDAWWDLRRRMQVQVSGFREGHRVG